MRKIVAFVVLNLGLVTLLKSQDFGNEWIEPNKPYLKMTVSTGSGIYRVGFAQLSSWLPADVDPKTLKLFFRGRQVPLHVEGEDDGVFGSGDFIEFYGIANDAFLDKMLYEKPQDHTNPYAVLYDNKTYYFLSWGGEKGLRIPVQKFDSQEQAQSFVWAETLTVLDEEMTAGQEFAGQFGKWVTHSHFFTNKGRTGKAMPNNANRKFTLTFPGFWASAPLNPRLEVMAVGKRPGQSSFSLFVGSTAIGSASFSGYTNYIHNQDMGAGLFVGSSLELTLVNTSLSVNTPIAISYVKLRYPCKTADFNTQRQTFYTQPSSQLANFYFESSRSSLRFFDVTDAYSIRQISTQFENGGYRFGWPNDTERAIMSVAEPLGVATIERIDFKPFQSDANYLIVTEARLRQPLGDSVDVVKMYADYRSSAVGGGHKVSVVNVNDLYDWFGFGEAHPLALRRYLAYMLKNGSPEYLFIIGQGLKAHYNYEKSKPASLGWANQHYVPGMGYPESDVLLSAGLLPDSSPFEPALATGRLPVQRREQVYDYLQKVMQHDTTSYIGGGKKNILHLSGGNNAFEIGTIGNFMKSSAQIAEGLFVGADVETITKSTSEAIQSVNISPQVNRGLSLLDFYGHGSLTSTQLDFGRPNSAERGYQNEGKYFGLTLWGCAGGDVFDYNQGILSDWVLAKKRGAILGYAHSSLGFLVDLGRMHGHLYESYFADSVAYKQPFGLFLKNWNSKFYKSSATLLGRAAIQQFIMVGDPAVHLLTNPGVDYDIAQTKVRFSTENKIPLTAFVDSFQIELPIRNNANFDPKTFSVLVERRFGDGTSKIYPKVDVAPFVKEKRIVITIVQPLAEKERAAGVNYFKFVVDPDSLIHELREDNNTFVSTLVLPKGSVTAVSPLDFSIVNAPNVTLYAVDNDLEGGQKNYLFEVDTADSFDSPLKKTYSVSAYYKITHTVSLNVPDSTVVYWRLRPENGTDLDWETRSFIYIHNGPRGWSQSHFPQFKSLSTIGSIVRNDHRRDWGFFSRDINMEVRSLGFRHPDSMGYYVKIDGVTYFEARAGEPCAEDAFAFAAIDPHTFKPYSPYRNHWFWNNLFCGNTSDFSYFHNSYLLGNWGGPINSYIFKQYYDRYKIGDFVVALSTLNYYHADVPSNRYLRHLELMGIDEAEYLQKAKQGYPFIALATKGNPQQKAQVLYADPNGDVPPIRQELKATFKLATLVDTSGSLVSPPIGPALIWKRLYFEFEGIDSDADIANVEVWGLDKEAKAVLLVENAKHGMALDTLIDTQIYAYVYLVAHLRDSKANTPPQLKYWRVVFEEYPEAILTYEGEGSRKKTAMQGQKVSFAYKLTNTSMVAFTDSIQVEHVLEEVKTGTARKFVQKLPALSPGQATVFEFKPNLGLDFAGQILVQTFANPFLQPELTFVNNVLNDEYWVNRDSINPMLDVLFDGTHIADGDFVAAQPNIEINLWDENEFFVYSDTSYLEVYLSPCPGCEPEKFPLLGSELEFFKPNGLKLTLKPLFKEEGVYQLKVLAYDISRNAMSYQISFRVDFSEQVSYFQAYPNPFSDRIYFDFVLKGKEKPQQAVIEIFDVIGHKVAELDMAQWSSLRVGRNEKVAVWDGRNQSGTPMAQGLYFYRVRFVSASGGTYPKGSVWPLDKPLRDNGKVILQR